MASRRDFLVVFSERFASALIAIASLRIMTFLLTPGEYGIFALLGTFQAFCGLFLVNPVGQHINRHTHAWFDDRTLLKRLVRYNRYICGVSLFISLPVIAWWYQFQTNVNDGSMMYALTAGVAVGTVVYVGTWNATLVPMLNLLGFRARSAFWMIVSIAVGLAFSILFVRQHHSAVAWMFGQAVGAAIGAGFAWLFLRRYHVDTQIDCYSDISVDLLDRHTIITFCLPLAAATGLMWLQNAGYRFVVGDFWGAEELGILVVGLGVSAQLWAIIESLAMQFLLPYLYRHFSDSKSDMQSGKALSDYINFLIPVYAVFAGFNAVCGAAVLHVLTDARYHVAAPFVVFGAMVEFARATTNVWSQAAQVKRRTAGVILPYFLGAGVVWLGSFSVAHYKGGLTGLSTVLVVAGFTTCASMIVIMQRLLPITISIQRWAAGLSVMVACLATAFIVPTQRAGLYSNIVMLLSGVVIAALLVAVMLWRNPALDHLLAVPLRKE